MARQRTRNLIVNLLAPRRRSQPVPDRFGLERRLSAPTSPRGATTSRSSRGLHGGHGRRSGCGSPWPPCLGAILDGKVAFPYTVSGLVGAAPLLAWGLYLRRRA